MSSKTRGDAGSEFASYRLTAFGLNIDCDWPLTGSVRASAKACLCSPATNVRRLTPEQIDAAWDEPGEPVLQPPIAGRSLPFSVERSNTHYRFWLQGFGRYLVKTDGTAIGCELGGVERHQHERFVFAQALPLAAVLQGYEVLHASAVCDDDGAVAFLGPSGAGKTAVASRLVIRGAGFMTDDVLAVELREAVALVHPGPAFMAIRPRDEVIAAAAGVLDPVGTTDKVHVSPPKLGRATRLRALYHLEPGQVVGITPVEHADPHRVLASAFVPYVMTPARLSRHLEIAQVVTSDVPQFRLQMPRTRLPDAMLETLEAHLRELGV
jgi:hypothetical protein